MKNIRVSKPFLLSISALLLFLNLGYASEAPTFKSKLFKSGNLLISDDFDHGKYKGRYGPNKKNVKQLANGTLEVLPLSGNPGDLTIFHIYNVPSKFVCHFRYKQVCSSSDAGAGIQIGGHKMHLGCTGDGYSLFLRNVGKTYKNSEVEDFKANQWIDMIIEYQQGKMLLNINGNETIFEHEGVNMDGAKSIVFKYRNIDRTLFDYVRLWEVTE